jgi:hypothetical protein
MPSERRRESRQNFVGAILGDNLGFWIWREIGFRLPLRYGGYIRLVCHLKRW